MPTVNMYEEDGKLIAEVSLPNFKKEEVTVRADDGFLHIAAEHTEQEEKQNKRHYFLREATNQYLRRIPLPEGAHAAETEAEFKHGVLKVSMPLEPLASAKEIPVT